MRLASFTPIRFALAGLGLLGLSGLSGCQPQLEGPAAARAGSLNFNSYVAVGNSLTAGFADGGLYNAGINASYPALLAQQFATTGQGPANFVQPTFSSARPDGSGYIRLQVVNGALAPVAPSVANQFLGQQVAYTGGRLPAPPLGSGQPELEAYSGAQPDNLGVPGISVLSATTQASTSPLIAGAAGIYGNLNPFYQRMLPAADRGRKDYLTFVSQKNPTFFTCWLGANDVLTFATAGGVVDLANPFSNLTDTTSFGRGYRAILGTLTKNGTVQGAVANIPNVTSIPYFTTVTVTAVAAAFRNANPASPGVFIQTNGTPAVRLATSADLLTLPASAAVATGLGSTPNNPVPNNLVLDQSEVANVLGRTAQLNAIIAKTALRFKVPVVDFNTYFTTVAQQGVATNAVSNTTAYVTGNLFSLDGVHPTPRGYALVANQFIQSINAYYGATIPQVNPNNYRGLLFP